jgi:hypothetical protein
MEAVTVLEIAQRFNAGSFIGRIFQSLGDERIVLSSRAGLVPKYDLDSQC